VTQLSEIAPKFVEMAHRIVWASAATVDSLGRPFNRILHPLWRWDGSRLEGWILTEPTKLKRAHLDKSPNVSLSYWAPSHDTCQAECRAEWQPDAAARAEAWDRFKNAPAPVGFDPAIIAQWKDGPTSPRFGVLHLAPWRIRLMAGEVMLKGVGQPLSWRE
jgi:hypothetical protein